MCGGSVRQFRVTKPVQHASHSFLQQQQEQQQLAELAAATLATCHMQHVVAAQHKKGNLQITLDSTRFELFALLPIKY